MCGRRLENCLRVPVYYILGTLFKINVGEHSKERTFSSADNVPSLFFVFGKL